MSTAALRKDARCIFDAALQAVDPAAAIRRHVVREGNQLNIGGRCCDLDRFENVYVVGTGKAGSVMAGAMESLLGDRLTGGVVNVKYGHATPLRCVKAVEAGHPIPDAAGVGGTEQIVELLASLGEDDLVFCLLSGGGSALLPLPAEGVTLEEKQAVTELLLQCGATINETNTVRKHISRVKGGQLARLASPARLVSLVLSDVIGDPLDIIASGPTVPDESTFADCRAILEKYGLRDRLPDTVIRHLDAGSKGTVPETPDSGDPVFGRTQTVMVANNRQALDSARIEAERRGYNPLVLSSSIDGETREVARIYAAMAREIEGYGDPVRRPACVISGGETTVTLKGGGKGGRNQEFVLATVSGIEGLKRTVVFSAGTDGTDGPTDAAGAVADGHTLVRAAEMGLDADACMDRSDAYHFFEPLGDLVMTGPTHTNVMDLRLLLVG
ncbi:MAG: glycerate kinase [Gemmatimonadetes bacterium]|nr:glycerate kinase [Gemmatimonadota bacterium]MYD25301.1 glycerate kinase [Gemmatimonadota bacterium]MYI98467.1 glycerate kinase [Gemmatimonadota bacterium]